MKSILFSVCGLLIFLVGYSEEVNVWDDMDVKEFRLISACIVQDGTKKSINTFTSCKGPPVVEAMINYCSNKVVPGAKSFPEAIHSIGRDFCLADKLYYCLNENIRCITCFEQKTELHHFLSCLRVIPKKFCPHGVKYKPMCKDSTVKSTPESDAECCVSKCISKRKYNFYEKLLRKKEKILNYKKDEVNHILDKKEELKDILDENDYYNNGYDKKDDYNTGYDKMDDYNTGYDKKDDYNTGYDKMDDYNNGYDKGDDYNYGYDKGGDYSSNYMNDYNMGYNKKDDYSSDYKDDYSTAYNKMYEYNTGYNKKNNYNNNYDYNNGYSKKDDYNNDYNKMDDYNMNYYEKNDYETPYSKGKWYAPNQTPQSNPAAQANEAVESDQAAE